MTKEQEQYIVDNFDNMSVESLRKSFNTKYGTNYKTTAFHYHTNRLGLVKFKNGIHKYTALEELFLQNNSALMSRSELAKAFNSTFNTNIDESAITTHCCQRNYHCADNGQFKRGSVPWEKTVGGRDEYVKKLKGGNSHSFKKGIIPHNTREMGSTRQYKDETYVKTKDGWLTARTVAYKEHYGEIPKGYKVIAVDGNKDNLDIANLRAVDNYTLIVLISNNWHDKGADIVYTGIQYSKLMKALSKYNIEVEYDND